ncbi:hypothetical protein [Streptomyces sp. Ag109_O5-1]|uniref:hypothetical protein n=1 Tax=Streptomyces sp. Ag109_O5-1 TaxID=1938851 RepID=UPI0026C87479|nr:hypothetical protein [Streptomyces sp. Ag109_O5-1]
MISGIVSLTQNAAQTHGSRCMKLVYEMAVLADRAGVLLTPQLVSELRQAPVMR